MDSSGTRKASMAIEGTGDHDDDRSPPDSYVHSLSSMKQEDMMNTGVEMKVKKTK
jgi:hypothetical protein